MRIRVIISGLLLIVSGSIFSQGVTVPTGELLYSKKPSITSPNAAALEKYVDFPAANYTGVADISIPLHTISVKGVTVPVILSYHAGGIKVEDIGSDVGIGWSLSTGGSINIMANGLIDEQSGFPSSDPSNFQKIKNLSFIGSYQGGMLDCFTAEEYSQNTFGGDPLDLYLGTDIYFLRNVVRQNADSEPDLYSYSFAGKSGKFFADENGVFRTIPYSEIKIERVLLNSQPVGYKVTDESGIVYEFKVKEDATETIYNQSASIYSIDYSTTRKSLTYNLSKITTPTGETVEFFYSQHLLTHDIQKTFSRARFPTTSINSSCWQFNGYGDYYFSTYTTGSKQIGAQRIDSIRASDGTLVKFLYSVTDRTDLPGSKALTKVEVWDYITGRTLINQYSFTQDYFTGRLTLKGVQEGTKPATQFSYSNIQLPDRLSYSQDAYGYFNNKNNYGTLLPMDEYNEFWNGADRSVQPMYIQAGMLTKIQHPTGGFTEYIYEPNEFYVSQTTTTYPKVIGAYLVSAPNQTVSANFTITSNSKRIRMNRADTWDGTTINNDYCIVHIYGPNNFHQSFVGNSTLNTPPLTLSPGQYTLSIENVGSTYNAEVTLYWFEETQVAPHNQIGGGVRIKEIKKYDQEGHVALNRKFEYTLAGSTNSSGLANNEPLFAENKSQTVNTPSGSSCYQTFCTYISQNSNSVAALTYNNGSHVLYKEVSTYLTDKTQNGYSWFKYNVSASGFNLGIPSFPNAPSIPYDWVNGTLLEQTDYAYKNSQYLAVKKVKNFYNYNDFDPQTNTTFQFKGYGAKIAIQDAPFICLAGCSGQGASNATISNISFGIQGYKFYSSWHRLDRAEETLYDENGSNPLTNFVNYYYDNSNRIQQTRLETVNSKGETIKTLITYPYDYPNTTVYDAMVSKNIISPSIELSSYKNGTTFLQATRASYNFWNNGWGINNSGSIIVPQYVEAKTLSNSYETRQQINQYDQQGNILEMQKPNDVKEVYLYGYNSNYPVAKVIGSDLVTVRSFVSQQILDNLNGQYTDAQMRTELNKIRVGLAATNAQVVTYTYKPFVGITSETDPNGKTIFYEYDGLNRLVLVRDKDNYVVKKICYNYYGQAEDCVNCNGSSTTPVWQNTTEYRCQVGNCGNYTGYQEQKQVDINPCSPSYNTFNWVQAGYNPGSCSPSSCVSLTSTNVQGTSGYTAAYTPSSGIGASFSFSVSTTAGLQSLGTIPEGSYTLQIFRSQGTPMWGTFKSGCYKQTSTGSSATFYNVSVSASTCNSITVDISGID